VRLALPAERAAPLASLIDVVRESRGWGRLSIRSRLLRLSTGLLLTTRIAIWHPRLLSLLNIVVLHAPSQIWHRQCDGSVLFQFVRPDRS
jgi:hypothetical protein